MAVIIELKMFSRRKAYMGFQFQTRYNLYNIRLSFKPPRALCYLEPNKVLFLVSHLKTRLSIALFWNDPRIKSISFQIFISKSNNQFELICKLWMLCFKSLHFPNIYLEHFDPRFRHYRAKYENERSVKNAISYVTLRGLTIVANDSNPK